MMSPNDSLCPVQHLIQWEFNCLEHAVSDCCLYGDETVEYSVQPATNV